MRIVVIEPSSRDSIAGALQRHKRTVTAFADARAALGVLGQEESVVLVRCSQRYGVSALRELRSHTLPAFVVAVCESDIPAPQLANVLAAGAQDFCRWPAPAEELVLRCEALERFAAWRSTREAPAWDPRKLATWPRIGGLVAEDLSTQLFQTLQATEGGTVDPAHHKGAQICLSHGENEVEIWVTLFFGSKALAQATTSLLGDDADDATVADMLREFANTAGGAIKRAMLEEGVSLTLNIPRSGRTASTTGALWTLTMEDGSVIVLGCEVASRENIFLRAAELSEGMVLVKDVHNGSGGLLMAGGTRLSSTSAERLGRILGDSMVLVARAA